MTEQSAPARVRRPELEQAFQHLANVAAKINFSGTTDPMQQWLTAARKHVVPRYGDVGPAISLEGVTFTPVIADGVAAEWVTAAGANLSHRILYIHGGGWMSGAPQDYRAYSATLARLSGTSILMVDYRLAPEHQFPAGLDDCVKAYRWILDNGPGSGKAGLAGRDTAERVSLAGDSAGGNLSAATCLRLAQGEGRMPDRLALIAGTLDNAATTERVGIDDPICTPEQLAACTAAYLPPSSNALDPLVSPVFASKELLCKFPPTLIQVSTIEALAHDNRRFAARLEDAGVRVNLSLWPELPHVWHAFLGLFPEAREALGEIADFLNR